jgi:hypothetical protein
MSIGALTGPAFWALHLVRVICQLGGLLRKAKMRFSVTRKGQAMLAEGRAGELYRQIFDTALARYCAPASGPCGTRQVPLCGPPSDGRQAP